MITEAEFGVLRMRVRELEGQLAFIYKHLGVTYVPEPSSNEDPRIIEQIKKGNLGEAIKIHRELNSSGLGEAKMAVDELKMKLGL